MKSLEWEAIRNGGSSSNCGVSRSEHQRKLRDLEQPQPQVFHVVVVLREKCKCKSLTDKDSIHVGYNH